MKQLTREKIMAVLTEVKSMGFSVGLSRSKRTDRFLKTILGIVG
jgi:hypothetical protein